MQVRAIQKGFYGVERRPGDVFAITDKAHFSKRWMEPVEKPKPAEKKEVKQ